MKSFITLSIGFSSMLLVVGFVGLPAVAAEGIGVGDEIVVAQPKVALQRGTATLATLSEGQRLIIVKTEGEWLGASVTLNGRAVTGWVQQRQVLTPAQYAQQRVTRRGFSYQPGQGASGSATGGRGSSRSRPNGFHMGQQYGPSYWRANRKITGY